MHYGTEAMNSYIYHRSDRRRSRSGFCLVRSGGSVFQSSPLRRVLRTEHINMKNSGNWEVSHIPKPTTGWKLRARRGSSRDRARAASLVSRPAAAVDKPPFSWVAAKVAPIH